MGRDAHLEALRACYDQYRQDHAAWRAASRARDSGLLQSSVDQLLRSRVALYRALQREGWRPAPATQAFLDRDAALLAFDDIPERTVIDLVEQAQRA